MARRHWLPIAAGVVVGAILVIRPIVSVGVASVSLEISCDRPLPHGWSVDLSTVRDRGELPHYGPREWMTLTPPATEPMSHSSNYAVREVGFTIFTRRWVSYRPTGLVATFRDSMGQERERQEFSIASVEERVAPMVLKVPPASDAGGRQF
jgi:hypothetical protein